MVDKKFGSHKKVGTSASQDGEFFRLSLRQMQTYSYDEEKQTEFSFQIIDSNSSLFHYKHSNTVHLFPCSKDGIL